MPDRTVASRYALAVLQLAEEAQLIDAVGGDLQRFAEVVLTHDAVLQKAFANPGFTREERAGVLNDVLAQLNVQPLTANFLRLVNDRRRLADAPAIAEVFAELADERAGRVRVDLTTAVPLPPQVEVQIKAELERATGRPVVLRTSLDRSLIAGMIGRIGGTVYDTSLRSQLEQLKHRLLTSPLESNA